MTTSEQIQDEKCAFNRAYADAVRAVESGDYAEASEHLSKASKHLANLETLATK